MGAFANVTKIDPGLITTASTGFRIPNRTTRKMRLQKRGNPLDALIFHYNPTEIIDNKSVDYSDEEVDGVNVPSAVYSKGSPRIMPMTLFFNQFGQGAKPIDLSVEDSIAWLRASMEPTGQSTNPEEFETAPPILELVWREVFTCVLTRCDVTRTIMNPSSMNAVRATVEIELREVPIPGVPLDAVGRLEKMVEKAESTVGVGKLESLVQRGEKRVGIR